MPKWGFSRPARPARFEIAVGGLALALILCDGSFAAPRPSSPAAPAKRADRPPFLEWTMPIGNLGSITCNARRYAINATWTLLAAPQDDGSVRLFDVATGELLPPLEGGWKVGTFTYTYADRVPPAYFAFSSDGRNLVWSWGKKVVVWDVASRQVLDRREVPGSSWGFDFSLYGGEGSQEKVAMALPAPPSPGSGSRVRAPTAGCSRSSTGQRRRDPGRPERVCRPRAPRAREGQPRAMHTVRQRSEAARSCSSAATDGSCATRAGSPTSGTSVRPSPGWWCARDC